MRLPSPAGSIEYLVVQETVANTEVVTSMRVEKMVMDLWAATRFRIFAFKIHNPEGLWEA
jgi:hypothetical protein